MSKPISHTPKIAVRFSVHAGSFLNVGGKLVSESDLVNAFLQHSVYEAKATNKEPLGLDEIAKRVLLHFILDHMVTPGNQLPASGVVVDEFPNNREPTSRDQVDTTTAPMPNTSVQVGLESPGNESVTSTNSGV